MPRFSPSVWRNCTVTCWWKRMTPDETWLSMPWDCFTRRRERSMALCGLRERTSNGCAPTRWRWRPGLTWRASRNWYRSCGFERSIWRKIWSRSFGSSLRNAMDRPHHWRWTGTGTSALGCGESWLQGIQSTHAQSTSLLPKAPGHGAHRTAAEPHLRAAPGFSLWPPGAAQPRVSRHETDAPLYLSRDSEGAWAPDISGLIELTRHLMKTS